MFVHDRETGKTQRVSLGPGGTQANSDSYQPSISADGRFVAFTSYATTLVPGDTNSDQDVFVRDRLNGTTELVSIRPNGRQDPWGSDNGHLSADGRHVAFDALLMPHSHSHQGSDQLVRDRQTGRTKVVRRGEDDCGSGVRAISPNGRFVTFYVECPYIVADGDQIFIYDRAR